MTAKKNTQESDSGALDLSVLTEFQFGPSWARQDGKKEYTEKKGAEPYREHSRGGDRRDGKFSRDARGRRNNSFSGEKRERGDRGDRFSRSNGNGRHPGRFGQEPERERAPLPEPAAGLRVELRPVDIGLAVCSAEVGKHKRVVSLYDFAKVIMGKRDRYDLVFMKQEGGPQMIASRKGDHACWLTRNEALKHIWKADWFEEFYESLTEDAEPPKGEFQAIGKCSMTGKLIGPVNWHGYQSALVNLHRSKFANMDFDRFKSKIQIEKGEEIVKEWLDSVSKKTVWKAKREGAEEVLADMAAVEKDFDENHFDDAYEMTDKVFINGAVSRNNVSPGIWAHIAKLSDITRKHPSMLIPNLCHGLARHHMPIFKWKGGHHTGPSRPRSLTPETVLADRMMAIMNWVLENNGKRVDAMLKQLCSDSSEEVEVPVQEADVPPADAAMESPAPAEAAATEEGNGDLKRQSLVKDLFWLCDQGYVLVFVDGRIAIPKNPEPTKTEKSKKKKASPSKKQKPLKEEAAAEAPSVSEGESTADETSEAETVKPATKKKAVAKKKPAAKVKKKSEPEKVEKAEAPEPADTADKAEEPPIEG